MTNKSYFNTQFFFYCCDIKVSKVGVWRVFRGESTPTRKAIDPAPRGQKLCTRFRPYPVGFFICVLYFTLNKCDLGTRRFSCRGVGGVGTRSEGAHV